MHTLNVHIEIKSTVTCLYLSETKMTSQIQEQRLKAENDKLKDMLWNNIYVDTSKTDWGNLRLWYWTQKLSEMTEDMIIKT